MIIIIIHLKSINPINHPNSHRCYPNNYYRRIPNNSHRLIHKTKGRQKLPNLTNCPPSLNMNNSFLFPLKI